MKADHKKITNRLNRIRGQLDGVIRMVEEDKYCLDISTQLIAISSAVNSVNREILIAHINSCVAESLKNGKEINVYEKIEEMEKIINKLGK
ncbi:metal-sensitive transcriptional regulator [Helcococcus sueciensis]|uniref:metal-sensitive transcriptional regulator n=1 Tax=Helcococcus sueciensis TaxID=241555 RepID=UPI0003FB8EB6|nr:metal-sensitive transcriptional regulator [Helcococcus sueciensis]